MDHRVTARWRIFQQPSGVKIFILWYQNEWMGLVRVSDSFWHFISSYLTLWNVAGSYNECDIDSILHTFQILYFCCLLTDCVSASIRVWITSFMAVIENFCHFLCQYLHYQAKLWCWKSVSWYGKQSQLLQRALTILFNTENSPNVRKFLVQFMLLLF